MTLGTLKQRVTGIFSGENLRAKTARGGAWMGSGSTVEQAFRFTRNMLLTRLLAPSAFGAMAIVLSSASLITTLSDVGIAPAIVQNPRGGEEEYLNAAWWIGLLRALVIYLIIFAAAPWAARFYGNDVLRPLLRVALLSTVLEGLISPRSKLAQKDMKFAKFAAITNGGAICGVILTIVLSFVLRSVWALAIGYCAEMGFRCVLSYIVYPGLPALRWDRHAYHELLQFSKGMFGLSLLNMIFARTDIFVLGKLFSSSELGLYSMAVNLVQTPGSFLIGMLASVLLPAFAHVREDKERVNRILTEVTSWTLVLGLPAVVALAVCAPKLLRLAYGKPYAAASTALIAAACVLLLNTLNALITTLFFAEGKPALHRRAVAASAIVMMVAAYPACKYMGLVGGQIAALVAIGASYLLQVICLRNITGMRLLRYSRSLLPALLISLIPLCAWFGARQLRIEDNPWMTLGIEALAFVLVAGLSIPVLQRFRAAR